MFVRPVARRYSTEPDPRPEPAWKWYNPLGYDLTDPFEWLLITGGFASGWLLHDWYNGVGFFEKKKIKRVTIRVGG